MQKRIATITSRDFRLDSSMITNQRVLLAAQMQHLDDQIQPWKQEIISESQATGFDLKENLKQIETMILGQIK